MKKRKIVTKQRIKSELKKRVTKDADPKKQKAKEAWFRKHVVVI